MDRALPTGQDELEGCKDLLDNENKQTHFAMPGITIAGASAARNHGVTLGIYDSTITVVNAKHCPTSKKHEMKRHENKSGCTVEKT